MTVEIDTNSGFCFGVVTAIKKAEEELDKSGKLFCLGDIVHNANEVERLCGKGLQTITHEELGNLHDVKVLLRAHGEPPKTYGLAEDNNITIIDATCPVVLQLQRRIKKAYDEGVELERQGGSKPLIVIYGKTGHAEVNGLVGQTNGEAVVVQDIDGLKDLDLSRDIILYSQTTKSLEGFRELVEEIKKRKKTGKFEYYDTICRQVANRMEKMREFAASHEVVFFVSGAKSSNGKVLFEKCREVNPHTYLISDETQIDFSKIGNAETVGICGATSTPLWLMEKVAEEIRTKTESETMDPFYSFEDCSDPRDEFFMKLALQEAEKAADMGEVPVGAVIVIDGKIMGKGHNMTEMLTDVTAHAEMLAITAASEKIGGKYLPQATLYVTVEPCPMCAGAIGWSRIGRLVYGTPDPKKGFTLYSATKPILHPSTIVTTGVLADECSSLMTEFFKTKRR